MPHVARLADADHNDLTLPAQRLDDQLDGPVEGAVELGAHRFERRQLDVEHSPGLGQMIHGARMPGKTPGFNQERRRGAAELSDPKGGRPREPEYRGQEGWNSGLAVTLALPNGHSSNSH